MNPFFDFLSHVSHDTIFATITALFVMLLGGFSKWLYDRIKQATTRRYLRNYFLHYLRSLVEANDKRIQSLKTVVARANIHTKDFAFVENSVRSEHVTQLPHTELFAALVRGSPSKKRERIVAYNELMGALDFLTRQVPIVKAQFGYFLKITRRMPKPGTAARIASFGFTESFSLMIIRIISRLPKIDFFLKSTKSTATGLLTRTKMTLK